MLILDSNIISYYLRGDPLVVSRLQALSPHDIGVPAIVEYELRYGLFALANRGRNAALGGLGRFAACNAVIAV